MKYKVFLILIVLFKLSSSETFNYNENHYYYDNANGFNMYQFGVIQGSGIIPEIESSFTTQSTNNQRFNEDNYNNLYNNTEKDYENIAN